MNVLSVTVEVRLVATAIAPPLVDARLLTKVLAVTLRIPPSFAIAPPEFCALLLIKVLVVTVRVLRWLRIAPPSPSDGSFDDVPLVIVRPEMLTVAWGEVPIS
ncbi:MAG TPA: hypothetical protein VMW65_14260, partial [Chloroflexota bacterium]|nr:hypothetical protein [Chloroflexota bacterium]